MRELLQQTWTGLEDWCGKEGKQHLRLLDQRGIVIPTTQDPCPCGCWERGFAPGGPARQ